MAFEEKRRLSQGLGSLAGDKLGVVMEIIAESQHFDSVRPFAICCTGCNILGDWLFLVASPWECMFAAELCFPAIVQPLRVSFCLFQPLAFPLTAGLVLWPPTAVIFRGIPQSAAMLHCHIIDCLHLKALRVWVRGAAG